MKRTIFVLTLLIFVAVAASSQTLLTQASNETSIQTASSSIDHAFANVLLAEQSGANVTSLLIRLNSAGELLSDAKNAYESGSSLNVSSKADSAAVIAIQVDSDASALILSSRGASQDKFVSTIAFSAVGITILTVSVLVAWQKFKRAYFKKLLRSKPEVVANQN